jgi:hypothetical protein
MKNNNQADPLADAARVMNATRDSSGAKNSDAPEHCEEKPADDGPLAAKTREALARLNRITLESEGRIRLLHYAILTHPGARGLAAAGRDSPFDRAVTDVARARALLRRLRARGCGITP